MIGGLGKVMLSGVGLDSMSGDIPETVFSMFQMTFAIITPALIVGAFAERMKFSAMMWFTGLWWYLFMRRFATGFGVVAGWVRWV